MGSRISIATVASVGVFAFGLEAVVHEVLGHAVVCWLTGGKVLLISSTAMQTGSASRFVPAAGPLANILFAVVALALYRARVTPSHFGGERGLARIGAARLFLYFFGFANLFLATGYIFYSGLIDFGDFAAVVAGIRPAWLYRVALVIAGGFGYRYAIVLAARYLRLLTSAPMTLGDARRIVYAGCAAGGGLFLLASVFNPISPSLILYDGLSGAVGMTLGFFLALTDLRQSAARPADDAESSVSIPFSLPLIIAAAIFAVAYLFTMGHGIRIS
jgi:hypothetical protein